MTTVAPTHPNCGLRRVEAEHDLYLGKTINRRWRIEMLIGRGGMANVYAATHRNGKRAAIKILHPECAIREDLRSRFLAEGYAANRVDHPGAPAVFDDGVTADGTLYLVMDLLKGETLFERCKAGRVRIDEREALVIANGLLSILESAHERGVIHRDIKPDNVFLSHDGSVKLLDFGIARVERPGRKHNTRAGFMMGTPAFMPPEQARGRHDAIDGRTDLWALAATLFWALTGRAVHEGETANEELLSAMTSRAPSLAAFGNFAGDLVEVIDKALEFDQADRFANAQTMRSEVRQALGAREGRQQLPPPSRSPEELRPAVSPAEAPCATTSSLLATPHPIPLRSHRVERGRRRPYRSLGAAATAVAGALVLASPSLDKSATVAAQPASAARGYEAVVAATLVETASEREPDPGSRSTREPGFKVTGGELRTDECQCSAASHVP